MKPAIFDSFKMQILQNVPIELRDQVQFSPQGMAYIIKNNNQIDVFGCPTCYNQKMTQNSIGIPIINGIKMLAWDERTNINSTPVSPEMAANIWFCPQCLRMFTDMLPIFISL